MGLQNIKVSAQQLLKLIPENMFSKLATITKVDYCAKVLQGERVFYLLLYGFLHSGKLSQRKLEQIFCSPSFKFLFNYSSDMKVGRSSISERLSKINVDFFKQSYELLYKELGKHYSEKEIFKMNLMRVDSTMVAETCNKLKKGFTVGKLADKKGSRRHQIKYTMAYDGFAVKLAEVLDEKEYLSEDRAMPKVVEQLIKSDKHHSNLYIFDRGLSALSSFKSIDSQEARFVGRIRTNRKMQFLRDLKTAETDIDLGKLELVEDKVVNLFNNESNRFDDTEYRIVIARFKEEKDTTRPQNKGKVKKVENEIYFITNDFELSAKEIAEIYGKRWDIEVFFRFLKQELSFSHFLSVSDNGIKVILYMTLITSMLLMLYKKFNELGYTMARFCFGLELEEWKIQLAILFCGGDVSKYGQVDYNRGIVKKL
ncbi:MAG: IS4 family transposase [Bacteroidales bacterium]|nr:IS4 family transposase [Bacteroidales bacterium]